MSILLPPATISAEETAEARLANEAAEGVKVWTLKDCIRHAMENNISLKKNQVSILSAQEDVMQSKAALLPTLSASTNQSVGWKPWMNSGMSTVTNGTVVNNVNKTYYNGSYSISSQWTLWNGNRNRNTIKQNRMTLEKAELDSATNANALKEQIADLYVQILYLNEAIKVNQQTLETSKKNEERGREMVEVGKMSKADLAQLTAQTKQDEYNIVSAQAQVDKAKTQLRQILELDGNVEFDVYVTEESDESALQVIPSLQTVYDNALATRPEIASGLIAIENQK